MMLVQFHRGCPESCRTRFDYEVMGLGETITIYLDRFESPQAFHWEGLVGGVKGGVWKWNGLGRVFTPRGGILFNLRAVHEPITEPVVKPRYQPDFE